MKKKHNHHTIHTIYIEYTNSFPKLQIHLQAKKNQHHSMTFVQLYREILQLYCTFLVTNPPPPLPRVSCISLCVLPAAVHLPINFIAIVMFSMSRDDQNSCQFRTFDITSHPMSLTAVELVSRSSHRKLPSSMLRMLTPTADDLEASITHGNFLFTTIASPVTVDLWSECARK